MGLHEDESNGKLGRTKVHVPGISESDGAKGGCMDGSQFYALLSLHKAEAAEGMAYFTAYFAVGRRAASD